MATQNHRAGTATPETTPAPFPGPDRVKIATQAAFDMEALLDALDRAGPNTTEYDDLIVAVQPRLRTLARLVMYALDDEDQSAESLQASYSGRA